MDVKTKLCKTLRRQTTTLGFVSPTLGKGLEMLRAWESMPARLHREGIGKAGDMGEHACSVTQLDLGCKSLLSSPPKPCSCSPLFLHLHWFPLGIFNSIPPPPVYGTPATLLHRMSSMYPGILPSFYMLTTVNPKKSWTLFTWIHFMFPRQMISCIIKIPDWSALFG